MVWIGKKTSKAQEEYLNSWHPWFAWRPVRVGTVNRNGYEHYAIAWLERVMRIRVGFYSYDKIFSRYEYRLLHMKG